MIRFNGRKERFAIRSIRQNGFTLIEVVLVLAIAGLIFLVVFMALPALQKSRRDTQRKSNLSRVIAMMESYHTNTGKLPVSASDITHFKDNYLIPSNLEDPSTGDYEYTGISLDTTNGHRKYPDDFGEILFKARHFCADGAYVFEKTPIITHKNEWTSTAAVWTKVEQGGYICIDNGGER